MKTEQLIVQYLYKNKKVTLQDIGSFVLSPEINIAPDADKDMALPPDAISFEYDPKAIADEGLVNYIVEHTRKIRPLATSDLESFIILNKQFLNIGKPLVLEGLGTLEKAQAGGYSFTQAGTSHYMPEEAPKIVTENYNDTVSFATPPKEKSAGNGKAALIGIIAVAAVAVALAAWYFINRNSGETDTAVTEILTEDSATAKQDTIKASLQQLPVKDSMPAPKALTDTNSFYIVIREYNNKEKAEKALAKLTSYGNRLTLVAVDSAHYKLRMPFKLPVADTLRIKDSLAKYFAAKTAVELPK